MVDMREAFLKAAKAKPQTDIAQEVTRVNRIVGNDRREDSRYEYLARQLNKLGNAVHQVAYNRFKYKGEHPQVLIPEWQRLMPVFQESPSSRREQLLTSFADGLKLRENGFHYRHEDSFNVYKMLGRQDLVKISEESGIDIKARILLAGIYFYEGLNFDISFEIEQRLRQVNKGLIKYTDVIKILSNSGMPRTSNNI